MNIIFKLSLSSIGINEEKVILIKLVRTAALRFLEVGNILNNAEIYFNPSFG